MFEAMLEGKLTDDEIRELWTAPRKPALEVSYGMIVELRAAEYAERPEKIVEAQFTMHLTRLA
jgi:hypothetical protein